MRFIYGYIIIILFLMCQNTIAQTYNDSIPVHETFTISSKKVNETRVVNVWLPPEYISGNDSLPVMYMPDGGIKEDFPHIANTLADLIARKEIKPIILVGIENTERRRDLTGPTIVKKDKEIAAKVGGSANFSAFINEELIPEINKKYRTTNYKGIIGESLAGLFVIETFLLQPDNFNFYIAFDPSLWWNNDYLDKNAAKYLANFPDKKSILWFARSSDISKKATNNMVKALKNIPTEKLNWQFANEPKEKHNTIFRATKEKAIIWTLNAE